MRRAPRWCRRSIASSPHRRGCSSTWRVTRPSAAAHHGWSCLEMREAPRGADMHEPRREAALRSAIRAELGSEVFAPNPNRLWYLLAVVAVIGLLSWAIATRDLPWFALVAAVV